ncbi:MAG: replication and repair protein RecF [Pseudomonadota bacterium]|jgi:DNA replication and repair protein RecF
MSGASQEREHQSETGNIWVRRLTVSNYRNYSNAQLQASPGLNVLFGANGAGKTNLLEALSLLAPGQGLRRAAYDELARRSGAGGWTVSAEVVSQGETVRIGTGLLPAGTEGRARAGRLVSIDGERCGPTALAELVEIVWLTPAMDGLFTGSASDRRRFLDRLILCFDPAIGTYASRFERAMRSRNRLLETGVRDDRQLAGLELQMAETGVAIAAARLEAVSALLHTINTRREQRPDSPFPWCDIVLQGGLEQDLAQRPAVDVEDDYAARLRSKRERDRAAGRTLEGPHRTDLCATHGPKAISAASCSTGEQKSLLIGLILAHAELLAGRRSGAPPILLLDEISAHLDALRREALYDEIIRIGAQAWMTGTDAEAFAGLQGRAAFLKVEEGRIEAQ